MSLNLGLSITIIVNFILMILWHMVVLIICRIGDDSFFNPIKPLYVEKNWEKNGKFYTHVLKIKLWKEHLPQYVAKNGFSKRNFKKITELHAEYVDRFIIETCRAEWNHLMCCMYWVVSFFINSFWFGLIFSVIPILANLPFLIVQRYNRIRLQKFSQKFSKNKVKKVSPISV